MLSRRGDPPDRVATDDSRRRFTRRKVVTRGVGLAAIGAVGATFLSETRSSTAAASTVTEQGAWAPAVVILEDAPTISVDASLGNDFRVTINGDRAVGNPLNPVSGPERHLSGDPGGGRRVHPQLGKQLPVLNGSPPADPQHRGWPDRPARLHLQRGQQHVAVRRVRKRVQLMPAERGYGGGTMKRRSLVRRSRPEAPIGGNPDPEDPMSRRGVLKRGLGLAAVGAVGGVMLSEALSSPASAATVTEQGAVAPTVVLLSDASTIALDASLGNDFRVTISGNRTMGNPSNAVDGQKILDPGDPGHRRALRPRVGHPLRVLDQSPPADSQHRRRPDRPACLRLQRRQEQVAAGRVRQRVQPNDA